MTSALELQKEKLLSASLEDKIEFSKAVIRKVLQDHDLQRVAVAVTGGKDSTFTLWLVRETCQELQCPVPTCMFIDEGDVFDEIDQFVDQLEKSWDLNIVRMKNHDVADRVSALFEEVRVVELDATNRSELQKIDFHEPAFAFEPESYVGNHLMKTVPMKRFLVDHRISALITAIRWDEQEARKGEDFTSPRQNPDHLRVHPILHFRELDVWQAIHRHQIPFCSLYRSGYRSLGAKSATQKVSDIPAWEQDLDNTPERAGRSQGKEQIMDKLRELGYM